MKALILAAGIGSRLFNKTKNTPKALVKINNKEILKHQLDCLKSYNIKKVCIVAGYNYQKIVSFLKKEKYFNFKIIKNTQFRKTDSAYSYNLANKFIDDEPYIHLNCDIMFSKKVLKKIIYSKKKNILSCRSDLKLGNNMDLICVKRSLITRFDNKYFKNSNYKVFGLAKFDPKFSKRLAEKIKADLKKNKRKQKCFSYLKDLSKEFKVSIAPFKENELVEINTLNDFKKHNKK